MALKVFKNICKNDEKLLMKLSQQFTKFLQKFFDIENENREEILSILIEFAVIEDNKKIMCQNGIFKDIFAMIKENCSIEACNFLSMMSTNIFYFEEIFAYSENIYALLLNAIMSDESKNWQKRSAALLAFQNLINLHGLHFLMEISDIISTSLSTILTNSEPTFITLILITILDKLACYSDIKVGICKTNALSTAVYSTFVSSRHSTKLIIRLFHLIANYIDQETFRTSFIEFKMCDMIRYYLQSHVNQMKMSVCNLINMSSNYQEITSRIVDDGVLKILLNNADCSICSDGCEAILNSDLSLKFSVMRKLNENDRIMSGFYASRTPRIDFMKMREIMKSDSESPICPIYMINFEDTEEISEIGRRVLKDRNLMELKKSLLNDEKFIIHEKSTKFRIIAQKVSQFLQTSDECASHNLSMHLKTLKFKFSSSVIPFGSLIYGNSFEAALLFKALADQANLDSTLITDVNGKSWNEIFDGNNIIDLIFNIGEIYELSSIAGQKYLQRIS